MPVQPTGGRSDMLKAVERQVRNWELARAQRVEPKVEDVAPDVVDFVTISRTAGCGGWAIASRLGERLGWAVFDRQILQVMAGDDEVRKRLYEQWDERDSSWLEAAMRWLTRGEMRKEDYFYRLTETILAIARQGNAVFLGRGADLILPRDRGLRVRIVASVDTRAKRLAAERGISEDEARDEIEKLDPERDEFRRQHYGKLADDPACYDLTVNVDTFGVDPAVELIQSALRNRGRQ